MAADNSMKLFVWEKILKNYRWGIAFALAPDVETARELIVNRHWSAKYSANILEDYHAYLQFCSEHGKLLDGDDIWELPDSSMPWLCNWQRLWFKIQQDPLIVEDPCGWIMEGGE